MYGKSDIRMKAMNSMMKDKPMFAKKKPMEMEMPMEAEGEEMPGEEMMGEEGFVSMPVSPEEKKMILAMRMKMKGGMHEEMEG